MFADSYTQPQHNVVKKSRAIQHNVFRNFKSDAYSTHIMRNRIKEWREIRDFSQQQLADKMGTTQQQVQHLESGNRKVSTEWLSKLAAALNVRASQLIDEEESVPQIPIIGYVGGGEEFYPIDDYSKGDGMEHVDMPMLSRSDISPRDLAAVKVRGDSMRPFIKEGWILYFTKQQDGVPDNCLKKLSVVMLKDGKAYVKELHKGTKEGRYRLNSYSNNHDPIEDVRVEWAAKVIAFEPPK